MIPVSHAHPAHPYTGNSNGDNEVKLVQSVVKYITKLYTY